MLWDAIGDQFNCPLSIAQSQTTFDRGYPMITVGFTLIGRGAWSGGETYLRNMLGIISSKLSDKVGAKLFLSAEQFKHVGTSFDQFLVQPAIVDPRVKGTGESFRALGALVTGCDKDFADLVGQHEISIVFQSAQWLGERFPVPLISWIPDFQHRHLPGLFSKLAWWKREVGFQIQTRSGHVIMLSSQDARRDCEQFYPKSRGRICVSPFAIDLDPTPVLSRIAEVRVRYDLPDRFIYLPNQFWSHKNHAVVVSALTILAETDRLDGVPPIVLTGRTEDPRDPYLYERLIDRADNCGLTAHFRHLGLVPYADVLALNAAADYLLNPSTFEGWSTPVEEAKALGTSMILSDLKVHREQAPEATYFPPSDAMALADVLQHLGTLPPPVRPPIATLASQQDERRGAFSTTLFAAFTVAAAARLGDSYGRTTA